MKDPNTIKIPFDLARTPRDQITAAVTCVPPAQCQQHPHEILPLAVDSIIRQTIGGENPLTVNFLRRFQCCSVCPHRETVTNRQVENCAAEGLRFGKYDCTVRDSDKRPVPSQCGSAPLDADRSVNDLSAAWEANQPELHCRRSGEKLHLRDVKVSPPSSSLAIQPRFFPCPQCKLEKLGITPDEAHASFENFRVAPPELKLQVEQCLAFAAAPKGVLILLGNNGTGKTHLAIAILRELVRQGKPGLHFTKHRHFTGAHRLALRPVAFGTIAPESPLAACQQASVLVYDELTASTDNYANEDLLLDLFEYRLGHFLPTIITTNLSVGELEAALGSRLYDRFRRANFAMLEFGFESKRKSLNADYLNHGQPDNQA